MKLMDFNADIPQFPKSSYHMDVFWHDLIRMVALQEKDGLNLNPDFQRGHVWTPDQQSRYVEYILRNGAGARDLHFNCPNYQGGTGELGPYEILDGKQRLTAVMGFMSGTVQAFGRYYNEFTGHLRMYCGFHWYIYEMPTRADVLKHYLDFNSAGTPHAEEEIQRVRALLAKETVKSR